MSRRTPSHIQIADAWQQRAAQGGPSTQGDVLKSAPGQDRRKGPLRPLVIYFQRHLQVLMSCLGQLYRAPIANLITILVIAIALSLPAGLYVGLENLRGLAAGWEVNAQISLFLKHSVDERQVNSVREALANHEGVARVDYISPEQGLEEFRTYSGFGDVLGLLDENPLPPVLVVHPASSSPDEIRRLFQEFEKRAEVDVAQLDLEWLQRLQAIMALLERAILSLAVILAMAVLLIVGNTIRVGVQQRRAEIEVSKLVGATNGFIRRPLLYHGLLQGFLGGFLAWLLVVVGLALLAGPVDRLAAVYQSDFTLMGLGWGASLLVVATGMVLGWLGAFFTVGYYLRQVEPS